jgi:hypothetical protein
MAAIDDPNGSANDAPSTPIWPSPAPPPAINNDPAPDVPESTVRSASQPPPSPPQPQYIMDGRCNPCIERSSRSRCNKTWPSCSKCVAEGTTEWCFAAMDNPAPEVTSITSSTTHNEADDDHDGPNRPHRPPSSPHNSSPPRNSSPPHASTVQYTSSHHTSRRSDPPRLQSTEPRRSGSPIRILGPPRGTRVRSPSHSHASGTPSHVDLDTEIAQLERIRQLRTELGIAERQLGARDTATPNGYTCKSFCPPCRCAPCIHCSPLHTHHNSPREPRCPIPYHAPRASCKSFSPRDLLHHHIVGTPWAHVPPLPTTFPYTDMSHILMSFTHQSEARAFQ